MFTVQSEPVFIYKMRCLTLSPSLLRSVSLDCVRPVMLHTAWSGWLLSTLMTASRMSERRSPLLVGMEEPSCDRSCGRHVYQA